jgi:hypothetical protein
MLKKNRGLRRDLRSKKNILAYAADLPSVLMHLVHNTFFTMRPFSSKLTFCRFGLKERLVARWENERLCPKVVAFPQFAHLAILQILSVP